MAEIIKNRYDFVILYDVKNGNPNGDPDAGNMPRVDPETGLGLITDVCIKRKIRNYVQTVKGDELGYRIYISKDAPLNTKDEEAYAAYNIAPGQKNTGISGNQIKDWLCKNYYDIRTFGAVLTTLSKDNFDGQVRGPVQIGFSQSIDPVIPQEVTITRVAITTAEDAKNKTTEMGKKYILPYGLYRCEGHISANLAQKTTGFTDDDLELLWSAIINMFEDDHSSARGEMAVRQLIVFKHDSSLGNAPAHKLFDLVDVQKKADVVTPRKYADYEVNVRESELPEGVAVEYKC